LRSTTRCALVEPEEYSAWTLYARAVKAEPNNAEAVAGLTKVADDLVRRGETALEQGRFEDARRVVERIRAALPAHPGAKALGAKIWPAVAPQLPTPETLKSPAETTRVARVEVAPAAPPKPAVDPLVQASDSFNAAMTAGRLLTPVETSAKHYLNVLIATNRDHELTQRARQALSRELLSRAAQSMEALDDEGAVIWINEAESIGARRRSQSARRADRSSDCARVGEADPGVRDESRHLRRAGLPDAGARSRPAGLGRRRVHGRHRRQDPRHHRGQRVERHAVPTRGDGRREAVAVRAARVHEPHDRSALFHADPLRPVARSPHPRPPHAPAATAPSRIEHNRSVRCGHGAPIGLRSPQSLSKKRLRRTPP
jgi:hypothetical protein